MDRSVVAALTSTTPRLKPESSAKDLASLRLVWDGSAVARHGAVTPAAVIAIARAARSGKAGRGTLWAPGTVPSRIVASNHRDVGNRWKYGRDSDLEAFSHNPSDGSFATLSRQTIAIPNV